eukprot:TCONS_00014465-protein
MAYWKSSVGITCEMTPQIYIYHMSRPFQNLVRINSYFGEPPINENDFVAYIRELTLINFGTYSIRDSCLTICRRGYFSSKGSFAQSIRELNEKHKTVIFWIDRIITRIERDLQHQNKTSLLPKKTKKKHFKKLLKNPSTVLQHSHYSIQKPRVRGQQACWIIPIIVILGIAIVVI